MALFALLKIVALTLNFVSFTITPIIADLFDSATIEKGAQSDLHFLCQPSEATDIVLSNWTTIDFITTNKKLYTLEGKVSKETGQVIVQFNGQVCHLQAHVVLAIRERDKKHIYIPRMVQKEEVEELVFLQLLSDGQLQLLLRTDNGQPEYYVYHQPRKTLTKTKLKKKMLLPILETFPNLQQIVEEQGLSFSNAKDVVFMFDAYNQYLASHLAKG